MLTRFRVMTFRKTADGKVRTVKPEIQEMFQKLVVADLIVKESQHNKNGHCGGKNTKKMLSTIPTAC